MKIVDSRFLTLIQLNMKTRHLLRDLPQSSVFSHQRRILFGISEVALRLLLIVVAFCMSRDVHHLASWLQIPAECSGLEHIYTRNCSYSFALLCLHKPYSGFLPPFCRSNQPYGWRGQLGQACGGGGSGGEPTDEPAPPPYEVRSISSAHGNELF